MLSAKRTRKNTSKMKAYLDEIENKKKYDAGVLAEYKLTNSGRFMPALYEFYLFCDKVKDTDITTNDQLLSFLEENGHFLFGGNGHFNLTKKIPMTFKTKGFDINIPFNNHKLFYMLFYNKDNINTILGNNSWAVGMAAGSPIKGIQSSAPKIKDLFKRLSKMEEIPKSNKFSIKIRNQLLKVIDGERLIDILSKAKYDKIQFDVKSSNLAVVYKSRDHSGSIPSPFISLDKTRTFMTPVFKGDTGEEFGVASVTVPVDDICTLSDKVSSIEQKTPPSIFEKTLMRLCNSNYNALLPPGVRKGGKKTRKNHR